MKALMTKATFTVKSLAAKIWTATAAAIAALFILSACGSIAPAESDRVAIVGAKLLPGGGGSVIDYSIVLVENGKFQAVGAQTSVRLPKDAKIVDGLGKTIEPADAGSPIAEGGVANLVLKSADGSARTMREGKWLQ